VLLQLAKLSAKSFIVFILTTQEVIFTCTITWNVEISQVWLQSDNQSSRSSVLLFCLWNRFHWNSRCFGCGWVVSTSVFYQLNGWVSLILESIYLFLSLAVNEVVCECGHDCCVDTWKLLVSGRVSADMKFKSCFCLNLNYCWKSCFSIKLKDSKFCGGKVVLKLFCC